MLGRRQFSLALLTFAVTRHTPSAGSDIVLPREELLKAIDAASQHAARDVKWPGYAETPFQIILVGTEYEYLFYPAAAADGFESLGKEPITGSLSFMRKRTFSSGFLATFPASGGISTIVVGYPENTPRPQIDDWSLTLLHEHFHQYQADAKDYYTRVDLLELANGDQTGMWMLNYPFPYDKQPTKAANAAMALSQAIKAIGTQNEKAKFRIFVKKHKAFRQSFAAKDWRYFAFQCWQEGVARFAEYDIGKVSKNPLWQAGAEKIYADITRELEKFDLAKDERVAIYPYGAGMAILAARHVKNFREGYLSLPLSLDPLFL